VFDNDVVAGALDVGDDNDGGGADVLLLSLTESFFDPMQNPSIASMLASAFAAALKDTKPKPRLAPVTISR